MNKKLLFGVLCIAIVAAGAASVVADTWLNRQITFRFATGTSSSVSLWKNCEKSAGAEPWVQSVSQGNTYEYTVYVFNDGTEMVYITYLPTDVTLDGGQTRFHITVDVINYGVPCQMTDNNLQLPTGVASLPFALPEKNIIAPTAGFPLGPNKMIKLDVMVRVDSVDTGTGGSGSWTVAFEVDAVKV